MIVGEGHQVETKVRKELQYGIIHGMRSAGVSWTLCLGQGWFAKGGLIIRRKTTPMLSRTHGHFEVCESHVCTTEDGP
jgi:hypothetical protein